ncbi:hypothetical protein OH76DRAFT_1397059 [Lentinus brumalis]|uniref:Uncharacterized protein n=1 Tax=Lentinus brumalis TaxID=2498619 RepID=A0A371DSY8_9APHY|nr:hypothetical protein OH76DRAFT_1397059 [Polyporus brumalis]
MVLITAFGLLWFAVLLGWRAMQQRTMSPGDAAGTDLASASRAGRGANTYSEGFTPGRRPYPCSSDSVYCVVEEWTYW